MLCEFHLKIDLKKDSKGENKVKISETWLKSKSLSQKNMSRGKVTFYFIFLGRNTCKKERKGIARSIHILGFVGGNLLTGQEFDGRDSGK